MSNIQIVEKKVRELYDAKNPNRADWADLLYENHVFLVADEARSLVGRFGGNENVAVASALLHDVADAVMKRDNPEHEEETKRIARKILVEAGFSEEEIKVVVDDAIELHSCFDGTAPATVEGKILATADSVVHLTSNFYIFAVWGAGKDGSDLKEVQKWAVKKIDRDFNSKLQFPEIKEEMKENYEQLRELFSRGI